MGKPTLTLLLVSAIGCRGGNGATPDGQVDAPSDAASDAPTDAPYEPIAPCVASDDTGVTSDVVASGFLDPVLVTAPAGDARLFVVEQGGRIIMLGETRGTFLDLRASAGGPVRATGNEQGLLGLAFHPGFAENGRFFVNYTRSPDGATVVAEYGVGENGLGDASSGATLLVVAQPFSNHNGGMIEFAPDGMLLVALGDGGNANDQPDNNAQNNTRLLGKLLRIDVDAVTAGKAYGIPADNPFAGSADGATDPRPEIWASGLRNPWRFSVDAVAAMLYIGDVGQNAIEEVNAVPSTTASVNYGWRLWEGNTCTGIGGGGCDTPQTPPISEHTHGDGWCSVIGGAVYRGTCMPALVGDYLYGDYCAGEVWALAYDGNSVSNRRQLAGSFGQEITSIYAGGDGELYLTNRGGTLRRLRAAP
ncbi:MAG: PQQ-dependent sugar dehydrogenase [Myxococcales bacterium]|nr:PQQ-dependent sugar dehydrogenase [Myxococcales bacterium]